MNNPQMNNQMNNGQNKGGNNPFNRNPIFTFAIFAIIIVLFFRSFSDGSLGGFGGEQGSANVSYSQLKQMIKNKEITNVAIAQTTIKATSSSGVVYSTRKVAGDNTLIPTLEEAGVPYSAYSESNWFSDILFSWVIPVFIFFAIWMFLAGRMQKNLGSGILGMGSAKGLINSERTKVKFDDVACVE